MGNFLFCEEIFFLMRYNIPYFKEIWQRSGYDKMAEDGSNLFDLFF